MQYLVAAIGLIYGTCLIDMIGLKQAFWHYLITAIRLICSTCLIDSKALPNMYVHYGFST